MESGAALLSPATNPPVYAVPVMHQSLTAHGGLVPSEMKRLRQLNEKDQRLNKLVADLPLTRKCCRRPCETSFEACAAASDHRWLEGTVCGQCPTSLSGPSGVPGDLSISSSSRSAGFFTENDSADGRDAHALWLPAY